MDVRQLRIVVIGAGVAGSAAAVALRRIGARVTVFEAYEQPAGAVGSFVSLAVNGQRGLAAIGCLDRVRACGFPVARQRIWSGNGKLLGDAARGRTADDPLWSVTLMRADLVRELREAAVEAGADLVTGERLVGLSQPPENRPPENRSPENGIGRDRCAEGGLSGDGTVRVTFAGGLVVEADLVVAADGIWSTARGLLDPDAPAPVYCGLYAVSGRSRGVELGRQGEQGAFNLTFARRATFVHLRDPDGEIWWSAQVKSPVAPVRDGVGEAEWLRRLAGLFTHDKVPAAIVAAATQVQGGTLMHRLDPVPVWHDDRVVLIGDAAHPVGAGQGASMAVEDALALAAALRGATAEGQHAASAVRDATAEGRHAASAVRDAGAGPRDAGVTVVGEGATVTEALAEYTRMRAARVTRMLEASDDNKDAKVAGALRSRVQDLMMPVSFRLFYERATAWLYDYTPPVLP